MFFVLDLYTSNNVGSLKIKYNGIDVKKFLTLEINSSNDFETINQKSTYVWRAHSVTVIIEGNGLDQPSSN